MIGTIRIADIQGCIMALPNTTGATALARDLSAITHVQYTELVDLCAKQRLDFTISNGSAVHARIIIKKLFEIASKEVVLISGTLREKSKKGEEIYAHPPLIDSAKMYLRGSDTSLKIVIQTGSIHEEGKNTFLNEVVNDSDRRGTVTVYLPDVGALKDHDTPHFMVTDREAYRFETKVDSSPENEKITAIANFGKAADARDIADYFNDLVSYLQNNSGLKSVTPYRAGMTYAAN